MKRNERKASKNKGAPKWMVTYSDMITLVLVFFILLFSMSQIDVMKFESVTRSFQSRAVFDFLPSAIPSEDITADDIEGSGGENLGNKNEGDGVDDGDIDLDGVINQLEEWEKKADGLARLMENVEEFLVNEDLSNLISANRTEEGVHLILQDSILFDSGEATVLESGEAFLDEVGRLLTEMDNKVRVEGHTDSRPISTYRYPSNWELSGARAGSVVRHFIEGQELNPSRFLIAGYGDTRPVVEDDTPENMNKNRRVEIVILDTANE